MRFFRREFFSIEDPGSFAFRSDPEKLSYVFRENGKLCHPLAQGRQKM
jgi:hypothetical protein